MNLFQVKEFAKYYNDPRLHGIRIGICVIADCNEGDVQSLVNARKLESARTLILAPVNIF